MNEKEALKELYKLRAVKQLCKALFGTILTRKQEEIVKAVAYDDHPRVFIRCMTRYGKSWGVTQGLLLWILFNQNKRLIIIAPTNEKTAIIRNYLTQFASKNQVFTDLLDLDRKGSDRIRKEVSRKRMTWKNGVDMRTLSAEGKGEQLMGFGADKIIVDEECDIDFDVYQGKITRMLGDNPNSTYVGICNPWHRDNQSWQHEIDPNWHKIHIGCDDALKEGRITQTFLDEQKQTLGEDSLFYKVLYRAEFPETSADALIDWKWIQAAQKPSEVTGEIVAGADIAEQGDDLTVVTIGIKDKETGRIKVTHIESWGKTDLMPGVAKLLPILEQHKVTRITIDANGVGSGFYSRLDELKREGKLKCKIIAYKGGLASDTDEKKDKYINIKAESYWTLRSLFEAGKIFIPNHSTLIKQLSQMKWERTTAMKIRIRDPGDKEGDTAENKSPDFSDSLNLMNWEGSKAPVSFGFVNLSSGEPKRGLKL